MTPGTINMNLQQQEMLDNETLKSKSIWLTSINKVPE